MHVRKLLELVSQKINERFLNLNSCFRFLDVDHTLSLSLNEFAQAIEHMRIKLSFDDIKLLFKFLDKNNNGTLGYTEFTMLLEERWRGIDPHTAKQKDYEVFHRNIFNDKDLKD